MTDFAMSDLMATSVPEPALRSVITRTEEVKREARMHDPTTEIKVAEIIRRETEGLDTKTEITQHVSDLIMND